VDGEGGDVGGADDAADGVGGAEVAAAFFQLVAEERGGERSVHKAGGDEIDANGGELKSEASYERGLGGGEGGNEREADGGAA